MHIILGSIKINNLDFTSIRDRVSFELIFSKGGEYTSLLKHYKLKHYVRIYIYVTLNLWNCLLREMDKNLPNSWKMQSRCLIPKLGHLLVLARHTRLKVFRIFEQRIYQVLVLRLVAIVETQKNYPIQTKQRLHIWLARIRRSTYFSHTLPYYAQRSRSRNYRIVFLSVLILFTHYFSQSMANGTPMVGEPAACAGLISTSSLKTTRCSRDIIKEHTTCIHRFVLINRKWSENRRSRDPQDHVANLQQNRDMCNIWHVCVSK